MSARPLDPSPGQRRGTGTPAACPCPSRSHQRRGTDRVVVAPDKFRGSLSASEVATAVAEGMRAVAADVDIRSLPVADGGEGTLAAAARAGFALIPATVTGASGAPIRTAFALRDGTAVLELAAICGHGTVSGPPRPLAAGTFGFGELIRHSLDAGARRLVLGIGGTVTTDGGAGMLQGLGYSLRDEVGRELPSGGGALVGLASIDERGRDRRLEACDVLVAHDVDSPLLGPTGAAAMFGPQKGASTADVRALERALGRWASLSAATTGIDAACRPGAGAAGGVGFAAQAHLGATARAGADVILELLEVDAVTRGATLVVTGEGHLDEQSLCGKAPVAVARVAASHGVPAVAVAGRCSIDATGLARAGLAGAYSLVSLEPDDETAIARAATLLRRTGATIARDWLMTKPPPRRGEPCRSESCWTTSS